MAVSTPIRQVTYTGDGVSASFAVPFPFTLASDLVLTQTNPGGTAFAVAPPSYSVVGSTINYAGLPAGALLNIARVVAYTQLMNLANQGGFYPAVINAGLDALEYQIQQLADGEAAINAALTTIEGDVETLEIEVAAADATLAALAGSNLSGSAVVATGGTAARFLVDRFGLDRPNAADFGAVGNGLLDSTAAIQLGINTLAARGGGTLEFDPGVYLISRTIVISTSSVRLVGRGRGGNHDTNPVLTAAVTFQWSGVVGGMMIDVQPSAGQQRIVDWGVIGIALVSGVFPYTSAAAYGLVASSAAHGEVDITTIEFLTAGFALGVVPGLAENNLSSHNKISQRFRQVNTAGTALQMSGNSAANSCFNLVEFIAGEFNSGIGIDMQDADNNTFLETYLQQVSGGAGYAMVLRGNGGGFGSARNNIWLHFSLSVEGGTIYSEGTDVRGNTLAAQANEIIKFDQANSSPTIKTGTGATFNWGTNTAPVGYRSIHLDQYNGYDLDSAGRWNVWMTCTMSAAGTQTFNYPGGIVFNNYAYSPQISIAGDGTGFGFTSVTTTGVTIESTVAGVFFVSVKGW